LELPLAKGTRVVFLEVRNYGDQFFFPVRRASQHQQRAQEEKHIILLGLFFGLLVFVLILNLMMLVLVRDGENRFYVGYLFFFIVLQLGLTGLGKMLLWGHSPYLANHLLPFSSSLAVLFMALFVRSFLGLRTHLPWADRFALGAALLLGINAIASLLPHPDVFAATVVLVNILTLALNLFILPVTVVRIRQGYKPARLLLAAFLALFVAVILFVLRNAGFISGSLWATYSLQLGSAVEVVLLTMALVYKFKAYRDSALENLRAINALQEEQTERLEQEVALRTEELALRHREIKDSIAYAGNIQRGLMPKLSDLHEAFSDIGVFYKPKEMVAGDFIWLHRNGSEVWLAVGDCTGHGVPGAMVSVVCIQALSRAVREEELASPAHILNRVQDLVHQSFSTTGHTINDGMDVGLVRIDVEQCAYSFSGANNGLLLLGAAGLESIKGDKQAIGGRAERRPFSEHHGHLVRGTKLVLCTDGVADQFGGPRSRKLMSATLRQWLLELQALSSKEAVEALSDRWEQWKGIEEQVDDVTLVMVGF
jgi:serine phosphatase RsbU (regulator of sigma subunit)